MSRSLLSPFLTTIVAARSTRSSSGVAVTDAKEKLASFISDLNTAQNGAYIFSGINTDVKPVKSYVTTPASAAQTAVAAAFAADFGMAQGAPGSEAITGAQMTAFLDGNYDALFNATNWSTTWSSCFGSEHHHSHFHERAHRDIDERE